MQRAVCALDLLRDAAHVCMRPRHDFFEVSRSVCGATTPSNELVRLRAVAPSRLGIGDPTSTGDTGLAVLCDGAQPRRELPDPEDLGKPLIGAQSLRLDEQRPNVRPTLIGDLKGRDLHQAMGPGASFARGCGLRTADCTRTRSHGIVAPTNQAGSISRSGGVDPAPARAIRTSASSIARRSVMAATILRLPVSSAAIHSSSVSTRCR